MNSIKVALIEPSVGKLAGAQKCAQVMYGVFYKKFNCSLVYTPDVESEISKKYSEVNPSVNLKKLPLSRILTRMMGKGKFDSYRIFKKLLYVAIGLAIGFFSHVFLAFKLRRDKVTHVYTYDLRGLALSGFIFRLFKIKLIWHLHSELHFPRLVKKVILLSSDIIIVPSKSIQKSIGNNDKIKVVYNGFPICPSVERVVKLKNKPRLDLIFVGSIVPHKGMHNIIDSLCLECLDAFEISLTVIGDYTGHHMHNYKKLIEQKLSRLPSNKKVVFLGWQDDAISLMTDYDLLIFSSVINQNIMLGDENTTIKSSEALPTVIIEAISKGLPVIATPAPGVEEIIHNGVDSLVLNNDTYTAIGEAIFSALNMDFYLNPIKVSSQFSLENLEANICDVFKTLEHRML